MALHTDGCGFLGWDKKDTETRLTKLDDDIFQLFQTNKQSQSILGIKTRITREISENLQENEINREFNRYGLKVKRLVQFGSSCTELASNSGDLDLSVILEPINISYRRKPKLLIDTLETMFREGKIIKNYSHFKKINAKVPILTFQVNKIQVDVSVHVGNSPPPSHIASRVFNANQRFEPNLAPLCFFLKHWFKKLEKTSKRRVPPFERIFPNSYATNLMVVFFFRNVGLLPDVVRQFPFFLNPVDVTWKSLDKNFSVPDSSVAIFRNNVEHRSWNLGELLFMFLNFYSKVVDLEKQQLNLNTGKIETKENQKSGLWITDRFDPFNPGRSLTNLISLNFAISEALKIAKGYTGNDGEALIDKLLKINLALESPPKSNDPPENAMHRQQPFSHRPNQQFNIMHYYPLLHPIPPTQNVHFMPPHRRPGRPSFPSWDSPLSRPRREF